jgi:hypothetical protein
MKNVRPVIESETASRLLIAVEPGFLLSGDFEQTKKQLERYQSLHEMIKNLQDKLDEEAEFDPVKYPKMCVGQCEERMLQLHSYMQKEIDKQLKPLQIERDDAQEEAP